MKKDPDIKTNVNIVKKLVILTELLVFFLFICSSIAMAHTGFPEEKSSMPLHADPPTPNDAANYTTSSASGLINVTKATPTIYWSKPTNIIYDTPLNSTQLGAYASVPETLVYTPQSGTVLSSGMHTLRASFTPTDTINYTQASASVLINVTQATPTII
jgi:hypothetical protein